MASHSSILAWRIPWTEEPGGLQSKWSQESHTTEQLNASHFPYFPSSLRQQKKKQKLYSLLLASPVSQTVKSLPAMRETWFNHWVGKMATHCSILAWKTPWMEEPARLQSMGSQRVGRDWATLPSLSGKNSHGSIRVFFTNSFPSPDQKGSGDFISQWLHYISWQECS